MKTAPTVDRLTYIRCLLAGNLHVPARDVTWLIREIERLDRDVAELSVMVRESCGCVGTWSP